MLEPHEERAQPERRYFGDLRLEAPQPPSVNPHRGSRAAGDLFGEQERLRNAGEGVSIGFFAGF